MLNILMLMEQHVGLKTYSDNFKTYLKKEITNLDHLVIDYAEITYHIPERINRYLPAPIRGIIGRIVGWWQVHTNLVGNKYDLIFSFTQSPATLARLDRYRTPYIICTDVTPIQYDRIAGLYNRSTRSFPLIHSFKQGRNRRVFQQAQKCIGWTDWVVDSLAQDYEVARENLTTIPIGIDHSKWQAVDRSGRSGRVKLLFVGGHFERKGGLVLLQAFETLPQDQVELHIVTKAKLDPNQENIFIYPNLTPNSPELIKLFQDCDVFVFPTLADTFGIVSVEAMSTALPIVASNITAIPEIVEHNKTGLLVPPNDSKQLAMALKTLIKNRELRLRLGQNGLRKAQQQYSLSQAYAKVVNLWQEVGNVHR